MKKINYFEMKRQQYLKERDALNYYYLCVHMNKKAEDLNLYMEGYRQAQRYLKNLEDKINDRRNRNL